MTFYHQLLSATSRQHRAISTGPWTGTQGNQNVFYSVKYPSVRPSEVLPCALTVVAQAELGTGGLRTWMLDNLVLLLAVAVLLL